VRRQSAKRDAANAKRQSARFWNHVWIPVDRVEDELTMACARLVEFVRPFCGEQKRPTLAVAAAEDRRANLRERWMVARSLAKHAHAEANVC